MEKENLFVCAVLVLLAMGSCFGGCEHYADGAQAKNGKTVSVLSWNVQALYDGSRDGWEYEEYQDGWTAEKYEARLCAISDAILTLGESTPDVIALIEVENEGILQKLISDYLAKSSYKYSFFARTRGNSLGIGVLSKKPFARAVSHLINTEGEVIPRPIVEVKFEFDGDDIYLFACHWKSKLGGDEKTEKLRMEAARVIIRRQREILAENPRAAIAVLGDLNENHDEFYRRSGTQVCALLPDDPEAARLAGFSKPEIYDEEPDDESGEDSTEAGGDVLSAESLSRQNFLIISEAKPPAALFFDGVDNNVFYSPWGGELEKGSYFYGGEWETIDHFLLNGGFFDKTGWDFDNCFVIDNEPFVNSKGEPSSYNPRTGSGLSDHLPLMLVLRQ